MQYVVGEHGADAWRITIDDSQYPPALDKMPPESAKDSPASYVGRLSVEGDVLKLCFVSGNVPRPPDISGDTSVAITFKRSHR